MEEAAELLPNDLVLEVLARVPIDNVSGLFRCAVACKRWRTLVADLSMLCRRWPEKTFHSSSLLGFFVQQQRCDPYNVLPQPVFLPPLSGSVLGSHSRSLTSFISGLADGDLDGAEPLIVRNGLLVVRVARRAKDDSARLAVCNLLAGTCTVLPSLKRGVFSVNCAILTGADCRSSNEYHQLSPLSPKYYSTFFKVLAIVPHDSSNDYREHNNLYTFSTAEHRWSQPTNCNDVLKQCGDRDLVILKCRHKAVVCGGMAHWLASSISKYYTLDVNVENGHVSLTNLSMPAKLLSTTRYGAPTLCVTASGSPLVFCVHVEELWLCMWARGDDGAWLHARMVDLKPPKKWNPLLVHVWSGEKSGLLLVIDAFRCVHKVDVESGAMEDVSQQFQNSLGMVAVPMEIDWPTLFMSRLGGG